MPRAFAACSHLVNTPCMCVAEARGCGTGGWRALARYKLCDVQTGVPTEAMCSLGTKPPKGERPPLN